IIDDFFETDKNHVFATPKDGIFSLNVPVETAFREPRAFARRSKIDWSCRYFLKSSALNKVWCRIMGHYIDWTSHIPELAKMDSEDQ
uniref:Uncharacterized protein n=1 Tax=Panagrolaimus sp. PS1159 TaxID=55785 RepID=A0AC35ERQ8_9BILA